MKSHERKVCSPDTTCGVFICGHILREVEDMWVFRRKNVGLKPLEWEYEGWDIVVESTRPISTIKHTEPTEKDVQDFLDGQLQDFLN